MRARMIVTAVLVLAFCQAAKPGPPAARNGFPLGFVHRVSFLGGLYPPGVRGSMGGRYRIGAAGRPDPRGP